MMRARTALDELQKFAPHLTRADLLLRLDSGIVFQNSRRSDGLRLAITQK